MIPDILFAVVDLPAFFRHFPVAAPVCRSPGALVSAKQVLHALSFAETDGGADVGRVHLRHHGRNDGEQSVHFAHAGGLHRQRQLQADRVQGVVDGL